MMNGGLHFDEINVSYSVNRFGLIFDLKKISVSQRQQLGQKLLDHPWWTVRLTWVKLMWFKVYIAFELIFDLYFYFYFYFYFRKKNYKAADIQRKIQCWLRRSWVEPRPQVGGKTAEKGCFGVLILPEFGEIWWSFINIRLIDCTRRQLSGILRKLLIIDCHYLY